MSIKVMSKVWEKSNQKGSALLCLLALADWSNDDGVSWYGIKKLFAKLRLSERETQRLIKALNATNELYVAYNGAPDKGPQGAANLYIVTTAQSASELQAILNKHGLKSVSASDILARGDKMPGVTSGAKKGRKNVTRSVSNSSIDLNDPSDLPEAAPPDGDVKAAITSLGKAIGIKILGLAPAIAEKHKYAGILAQEAAGKWRAALELSKFNADHYARVERSLDVYIDWYDKKHKGTMSLPQNRDSFGTSYGQFVTYIMSNKQRENAEHHYDPACPYCKGGGVRQYSDGADECQCWKTYNKGGAK